MEEKEHELEKMERYLTWGTTQNLRKTWKSGMRRTGKKMTTSTMNEIESILRRKHWTELLEIQQQKNKLVVDLWITSQNYEVVTYHKRKRLKSWEHRGNAKLHFRRIWRINCTLRSKKKILELRLQESWWTLEEWIKSWRATVMNFGNKRKPR